MKRLILIDSHALIHRAYHALPPLTTKSGELVNAVYGFTSILIKTISNFKPDYIVAAFDAPGATFRHEEYKEYKATRVKAPDDLYAQIPRVKEILTAFKIPIFEKSGYEADDIIGTVAEKIQSKDGKNVQILILTGDMDNLQLISKNVSVLYAPPSVAKEQIIYDAKKVKERFEGLSPEQMIDFKGLKGDPSDNIPGVRGIGEKTAISLLNRFKTIEKLYEAMEKNKTSDISDSVLEKLKSGKIAAFFSKKLATIKRNVPIKFNLKESEFGKFDKNKIIEIFQNLGFVSLINRLSGGQKLVSAEAMAGKQGTLAMSPSVSIVGSSVSNKVSNKGRIGYDFKSFIKTSPGKQMVIGSGDFDVMIAAYVLNPGERDYSLEKLSLKEFGAVLTEAEAISKLAPVFKNRLIETETEKVFKEIEMPLIPILAKMEIAGIKLDVKRVNKLSNYLGKELKKLQNEIYKLAGEKFNINSPQQLSEILFLKLKIPGALAGGRVKKTPGGALATGAVELEKLRPRHKIIDFILKYRELSKLKSTYTDTLPNMVDSNGRIHTTFNQTGTASGRLSSQDPNLQNIPLANDKKMMEAFKKGIDIHKFTASEINNVPIQKVTPQMRFAAKALNFGIIYGMGAQSFAESAGISKEKAKEFIIEYLNDFSGVAGYIKELQEEAKQKGYTTTLFGRRRYLPEINSPSPMLRAQAERIAVNMPIQGLEADIIKKAMIEIDNWIKNEKLEDEIKLLLQVHDELLFEAKNDSISKLTPKIVELMEGVIKLKVPILAEAKIGDNWGNA